MPKYVVYSIESADGRQYIGATSDFKKRIYIHRRALIRGRHHCAALQAAFDCRTASFKARVIEEVGSSREMYARERYHLRHALNVYNTAYFMGATS